MAVSDGYVILSVMPSLPPAYADGKEGLAGGPSQPESGRSLFESSL